MKINQCLLDRSNAIMVKDVSIGDLIGASGKQHLWNDRSQSAIDVIVMHYTSAAVAAPLTPFDRGSILKIFCEYGVSSHYLIDRKGRVDLLVPEEKKAWHAGGSIMPEPDNRTGVNEFSIGIELMATDVSGFTAAQYRSLAELCAAIEQRYGRRFAFVGHEQIAGERAVALGLRGDRKVDPGRLFEWERFSGCLREERQRSNRA
jgi:N-acetyl-anhydromuramyl-L-alanine amidase AmpD